MEKLANRFSEKIAFELKLDSDKKEVVAYGTFALLHMFLSILLILVLGFALNVPVEALIITFTGSALRKYSGGAHASTPGRCAILGAIIAVGLAILVTAVVLPLVNFTVMFVIICITFLCGYYIVCTLAPVDSAAKPIKKQEKRNRMRKGSIFVLSAYAIIVQACVLLYYFSGRETLKTFPLCICAGVLWQTFTMVNTGRKTINKLENLFNHISTLIKKERII